MLEINLSCPNIKGKPQIGYDFEEFKSYLRILESLDTHLLIIGCGGVTSGTYVFEHILAGATLVQVGSQLMKEGPSCFSRIKNELEEIMEKKDIIN